VHQRLVSRHFARSFLPLGTWTVWRDARSARALKFTHRPGTYNAVQRLAYVAALLLGVVLVLSGLTRRGSNRAVYGLH